MWGEFLTKVKKRLKTFNVFQDDPFFHRKTSLAQKGRRGFVQNHWKIMLKAPSRMRKEKLKAEKSRIYRPVLPLFCRLYSR